MTSRQPRTLVVLLVGLLLAVGAPTVAAADPGAPGRDAAEVLADLGPVPVTEDGTVRLVVRPDQPMASAATAASAALPGSVGVRALYGSDAVVVEVPATGLEHAVEALAGSGLEVVELDGEARAAIEPNDPLWDRDEHEGFRISRFPEAWSITTGSPDVVIAILDTGVTPVSEISGRVLPGRNFISGGTNTLDDHTTDGFSHGTMSATVAAARGNNGAGLAGGCWRCSILPVKVLGSNGAGPLTAVAEGIRWAADNGADVINMSLTSFTDASVVRDAVAYARQRGVLLVAAAGNQGTSSPVYYPAGYPDVVGVAGVDSDLTLSRFSNRGSWVSVAATFVNPAQASDGDYYAFAGTSSASPMVAGAAALGIAAESSITVGELERRLTEHALPTSGIRHGTIDAARVADGVGPQVVVITYPGSLFGREVIGVLATDPISGLDGPPTLRVGTQALDLDSASSGAWVAEWDTTEIDHGTRTLTAEATDDLGNTTTVTRTVSVINRPPPNGFADVPRSAYFAEPVDFLKHTGVTTGAGGGTEYRPGDLVTRAQMAVFLWRMAGEPVAGGPAFDDVPAGSFAADATRWMRQAGITTGVGGNRYDPAGQVTRAQMVTFLHRFSGVPTPPSRHGFSDVDPIAYQFAVNAISWAAHHGITGGVDEVRFGPAGSVTRAQMSAFLHRYARTRAAHGSAAVPLGI